MTCQYCKANSDFYCLSCRENVCQRCVDAFRPICKLVYANTRSFCILKPHNDTKCKPKLCNNL